MTVNDRLLPSRLRRAAAATARIAASAALVAAVAAGCASGTGSSAVPGTTPATTPTPSAPASPAGTPVPPSAPTLAPSAPTLPPSATSTPVPSPAGSPLPSARLTTPPPSPATPPPSPATPPPAVGPLTADEAVALVLTVDPRFGVLKPRDLGMIGQSAWYEVVPTGTGYLVTVSIGWGDCPSGCIERRTWVYSVSASGVVELVSVSGADGPPTE